MGISLCQTPGRTGCQATPSATSSLNSPSITAEEAPKLKPFVALAEKIGALAGQMVDFGIKAIDIAFEGTSKPLRHRLLLETASLAPGADTTFALRIPHSGGKVPKVSVSLAAEDAPAR